MHHRRETLLTSCYRWKLNSKEINFGILWCGPISHLLWIAHWQANRAKWKQSKSNLNLPIVCEIQCRDGQECEIQLFNAEYGTERGLIRLGTQGDGLWPGQWQVQIAIGPHHGYWNGAPTIVLSGIKGKCHQIGLWSLVHLLMHHSVRQGPQDPRSPSSIPLHPICYVRQQGHCITFYI